MYWVDKQEKETLTKRKNSPKPVIAASEPQSREVRVTKGIAGRARNDEVCLFISTR